MVSVTAPDPAASVSLKDGTLLRTASYIAGRWVDDLDDSGAHVQNDDAKGQLRAVCNPASNEKITTVRTATRDDSVSAIESAAQAFPAWSRALPQERAQCLRAWFELISANREDLARLMTLEQGKPIGEARGEIDYAASFVEFYAEEAKRPNVESVTSPFADAEVEVWLEPLGIAGLVTPWNFPSAMLTRKAAAALAVGCPVLAHPSIETPLSALALAELARRSGFPAGVVNVLVGDAATLVGPWLDDVRVRVLSFTGSTEVGRKLYGACAATVKRMVMELGGHAPFIVFADAEFEHALNEAVKAKFATSGQDCLAANRIYVERPVYERFCAAFAERTAALRVGDGLSNPDIGPLINFRAVGKQIEQIEDAIKGGARLLTGGRRSDQGQNYVTPTVLTDVPDDALIMQEETFGPVAALTVFDDEQEVIRRANATEYGLVAYVHTRDPGRIYRVSRALEYGMVAINRTKVTGAPIPFGGIKQSGLGREGARSGMLAFAELKYVCRDYGDRSAGASSAGTA